MSTTTSRPAPVTPTVPEFTVLQVGGTAGKKVRYEITAPEASGAGDAPLARAFVRLPPYPRPSGRLRRPPVDVFEGAGGDVVCTLQPLHPDGVGESAGQPAGGTDTDGHDGGDGYELRAADGTSLARLEHRPGRLLPWPRRPRWQVRLPVGADGEARSGEPWLTGTVGAWYRWAGYVLVAPVVWPLLAVAFLLLDGDALPPWAARGPRGVRWRAADGRVPLERRGRRVRRRRDGTAYRLDGRRLDPRIAYAQAVLVEWDQHRAR